MGDENQGSGLPPQGRQIDFDDCALSLHPLPLHNRPLAGLTLVILKGNPLSKIPRQIFLEGAAVGGLDLALLLEGLLGLHAQLSQPPFVGGVEI